MVAGKLYLLTINGEVPERSNGAVSKTVVRASVPRVRIPPSPPINILLIIIYPYSFKRSRKPTNYPLLTVLLGVALIWWRAVAEQQLAVIMPLSLFTSLAVRSSNVVGHVAASGGPGAFQNALRAILSTGFPAQPRPLRRLSSCCGAECCHWLRYMIVRSSA
jgi:hypothetical protein